MDLPWEGHFIDSGSPSQGESECLAPSALETAQLPWKPDTSGLLSRLLLDSA